MSDKWNENEGERETRDDWMRGVLVDSELSPFARVVGIHLALSVVSEHWPAVRLVNHYAIGCEVGLPTDVVDKAVDALF
jgi:hypothetical protein